MLARCTTQCSRWFRNLAGRIRRALARCLARASAGFIPDQSQMGFGLTKDAANRKVIWWWTSKWMTVNERRFVEIEVPSFQIDRVLVAAGIVDSRSNAQRLIKSGGITWRRSDGEMVWTKVTDFRQEIEPGWPVILRVGDGHWRSVMVEVMGIHGKPTMKAKQFPSLAEVMRPAEDQTIGVWTNLWK